MKTLQDLLDESVKKNKKDQEIYACQFNKTALMLERDYGIRSVHLVFIVRDILERVGQGETILNMEVSNNDT